MLSVLALPAHTTVECRAALVASEALNVPTQEAFDAMMADERMAAGFQSLAATMGKEPILNSWQS